MNATLEHLTIGTVFKFNGMTLRKGSTLGPCNPQTMKAGGKAYGCSSDIKLGGQFQISPELQVWLPLETVVIVD